MTTGGGGGSVATGADRLVARLRATSPLELYAAAVGLLGLGLLTALVRLSPPWVGVQAPVVALAGLAVALVCGELTDVPMTRSDQSIESVTISTTFAVAMVVLGPLSLLLVVHSLAVAADDVRTRRRPLQMLFNGGQYAISIVAARATFWACTRVPLPGAHPVPFLTGEASFTAGMLVPGLLAGAVFAIVNDRLVAVVAWLQSGQPLLQVRQDDLRFKLETSGVLVALGPIAALVVTTSVLMLPLLLAPILAVRRTAQVAAMREHQSLHDPLTGLANRELFRRRVERALRDGRGGVAVLMLDLDHFKDVNDTLGHHIGDQLLCEVADRVQAAATRLEADVEVARLGGDEFAVLLVGDHPQQRGLTLAAAVLDCFARPIDAGSTRLSVQASVGITSTETGPLDDVNVAMQQADIALYEAKQERARASLFHAGAFTASADRLRLLPELREAVANGQLVVRYQPQVDARTGSVASVEALVRWQHPTLGHLGPAAFIDLAESSGLIASISTFVMREALLATAGWRALGIDLAVAVNLSARQLSDLNLPGTVGRLLAEAGLPGSALTVEVTENSLMSDARAARTILLALRDMGVQLSIDDFGTGYSSLVLLKQLDVDEIKVDRSFVTGLLPGAHDEVLVRSIIELGHNLGLRVVGEGVEAESVADRLRTLGCDRMQGYLYGRPLTHDQTTTLLLRGPRVLHAGGHVVLARGRRVTLPDDLLRPPQVPGSATATVRGRTDAVVRPFPRAAGGW